MHLVLTADPHFWPQDGREKIFLGRWCVSASLIDEENQYERAILPYPFDEMNSQSKAYHYLQQVYKRLFPQIVEIMNTIHQCHYDRRYWEIVVGYWLREYMEVLYERYCCLQVAAISYPKAKVILLSLSDYVCPTDSRHFSSMYVDDFYNQQLYSQIIRSCDFFVIEDELSRHSYSYARNPNLQIPGDSIKKKLVRRLSLFLSKWNKIFISSSYLPLPTLLSVAFRLKIFPTIDVPHFSASTKVIDRNARSLFSDLEVIDAFENVVRDTLANAVPMNYIEKFSMLNGFVERSYPKGKVKLIVTANSFAVNDGFKLWTAKQIADYQTRFIILQHGGNYGCGKINSSEDYEVAISDYYLTYGWKTPGKHNVMPFVSNRLRYVKDKKIIADADGMILWILASFPRYSYTLYSVPMGPQFYQYLLSQADFLKALDDEPRTLLKARPYRYQYGWNDEAIIRQFAGDFQVANLRQSMWRQLRDTRLCVCTYNATTHLETFAANVPTILYWDPKHWEIRAEAKALHDQLYDVGILYHSAEAAAAKVNEIFYQTLDWWHEPKIQQARKDFCGWFARTSLNSARDWSQLLKKLAS